MPVEGDFDNIDSLDPTFPFNDDPVAEGPQHLRGIKNALQGNVTGDDAETRLLVNDIVRALLNISGLTLDGVNLFVKGDTIDLDNSLADAVTIFRMRNADGGLAFERFPGPDGTVFIRQIDFDSGNPKNWGAFERDGGVKWRFNGAEAFATIDPTRNSSAEVRDIGGGQHPIGYNTLPPLIISGNTTLEALHNGKMLQITNNITLTLAVPFQGFAFNVICATAVGDIAVPAGQTVFLYEGFQRRNFAGPATLTLNLGSALTLVQNTGTSWNAWGGDVA